MDDSPGSRDGRAFDAFGEATMQRQKLTGAATAAVGAAMMVNALLGPLVLRAIQFHASGGLETQLVGGEMTSLFIAGPWAIVAGTLWWRGNPRGPSLALGPLGYALYTFIQLVLAPDYARYPGNNEQLFAFHLFVVMTSWIVGLAAWRELQSRLLAAPTPRTRLLLGGLLIGVNVAFALGWWGSIAAVYTNAASLEYRAHPTAFWLIRLMDLGFIIPVGILTGAGLLARKEWGTRLAYAFAGVQALLACAVAGMAVRMWLAGGASGWMAALMGGVAGALLLLYSSLVHCRPSPEPGRVKGRSVHASAAP
jgi:hypothetical protein